MTSYCFSGRVMPYCFSGRVTSYCFSGRVIPLTSYCFSGRVTSYCFSERVSSYSFSGRDVIPLLQESEVILLLRTCHVILLLRASHVILLLRASHTSHASVFDLLSLHLCLGGSAHADPGILATGTLVTHRLPPSWPGGKASAPNTADLGFVSLFLRASHSSHIILLLRESDIILLLRASHTHHVILLLRASDVIIASPGE